MEKIFKLDEEEEIIIIGKNSRVKIKNCHGNLQTSEIKTPPKGEKIYIKQLDVPFLTSFVLSKLLEDNKDKAVNQDAVNKILDNHYDLILGDNYKSDEIKNIIFQAITYFE